MSKKKIIAVCETSNLPCDNQIMPYEVAVKGGSHYFCCEQGFKQSLKDFSKYITITKKKKNKV